MYKKIFISLVISGFSFLFAQNSFNSKSVVAYRNAVIYFDNNDYGRALRNAEDAVAFKKNQIENEVTILSTSLASREVKKAGENISNIISVLEDRGEKDCIKIIKFYTEKKGYEFFNNSIYELLDYIKKQEAYPEASKLIGDVFKIEGEYDFAETYYLQAFDNRDILDIPDEKYEILYNLAEISRLKKDYNKMEVRLLNIIDSVQVERNNLIIKSLKNLMKTNEKNAIVKMFEMYRSEGYYYLNAYSQLAQYYYELNEYEKAFYYSSIAVITGFSKIYEVLEKREMDFEFSDLQNFLTTVSFHGDIVQWGQENEVWKSFNYFCRVCQKAGYKDFSTKLLIILSQYSPIAYWQQEAVLQLDISDGIKNPD